MNLPVSYFEYMHCRKGTNVRSFFFYGSLMDPELRALVLGRPALSAPERPAVLAGYRRSSLNGCNYPGIAPAPDKRVDGLLVEGINEEAAARLSYYEGEQYEPVRASVATAEGAATVAWVFQPLSHLNIGFNDWVLSDWQRRWKASALKYTKTSMARMTQTDLRMHSAQWRIRTK